ncbi:MAG: MBL fold metallo-hydrolase [Clostridiales bacterium]|nr:MBL fold metallo-hydrolase [Clostridiales bacterium]
MARFCPLYSSSRGNCTYIGGASGAILIDVGVSAKKVEEALRGIDVDINSIGAIFVTHEHTDHIQGLRVFASRHKIDVYASPGTLEALESKQVLNGAFEAKAINSDRVEVCGMSVSSFPTNHDAVESVGYRVLTPDERTISITTDTGMVSPENLEGMLGSDLVMLESNHDINMLMCGPYPYVVKRRVLSELGHLSNEACAATALTLLENGTTRFVLGHLSQNNNLPALALETTRSLFEQEGAKEGEDYLLQVAGDFCENEMIVL